MSRFYLDDRLIYATHSHPSCASGVPAVPTRRQMMCVCDADMRMKASSRRGDVNKYRNMRCTGSSVLFLFLRRIKCHRQNPAAASVLLGRHRHGVASSAQPRVQTMREGKCLFYEQAIMRGWVKGTEGESARHTGRHFD